MSRSLIALWIVLCAAIASISALAFFWNAQRTQIAEKRVEDLLQLQLEPHRRSIAAVLEEHSLTLQKELAGCDWSDLQACVQLTRSPLADAVVVVNRDNQVHFPRDANLSTDRSTLVDEAQQLLREQADPRKLAQTNSLANNAEDLTVSNREELGSYRARSYTAQSNRIESQQQLAQTPNLPSSSIRMQALLPESLGKDQSAEQSPVGESAIAPVDEGFGWMTWYHRRGIVLGFWWRQSDAWRTLVVLPRARWMADLVACLPETQHVAGATADKLAAQPLSGSLMQLIDVEGNLIYQWGTTPQAQWEQLAASAPAASLSLDDPLDGWRLRVFASPELRMRLSGDTLFLPLLLAVLGLSLTLVLVGGLVTININRQWKLAERRVSFVNQVSHELRTPLTNIRMYADLLAQSLGAEASDEHEAAAVTSEAQAESSRALERIGIIQSESQRLSRLIGNVLEFARRDRQRELRTIPTVLDQVVRDVVETFRPRLEQVGFAVDLQLDAAEPRQLDGGSVEQILVNLISNAEKYAASGKRLEIVTRSDGDYVTIDVTDFGPGIPRRWAESIFAPFTRMSDRLEDPAGTGIGLTIVRQLSQEHGGSCDLVPTTVGATFRCRLLAKQIG